MQQVQHRHNVRLWWIARSQTSLQSSPAPTGRLQPALSSLVAHGRSISSRGTRAHPTKIKSLWYWPCVVAPKVALPVKWSNVLMSPNDQVTCVSCGFLAARTKREGKYRPHTGYFEVESEDRTSPCAEFP